MQIYLANRYFLFDGSLHAFPMIDLVNHSSFAPTYSTHGGFGTSYVVEGELLVNYNSCDPWGIMLNYGFAARGPAANSLGISVDLGTATLRVDRETTVLVRENEMRLPALQRNGSALMLPFLVLGFSPAPELPRTILHRVLDGFERSAVDRLFDAIAHYNRTRFIALLRLLRGARGPLYRELEEAAIDQLEALSFAVGAR